MELATSDANAFERVLQRLQDDVGAMMRVIRFVRTHQNRFPGTIDPPIWQGSKVPMFALARMTFPIAESLGDLIYRNDHTTENLRNILSNELDDVRRGYKANAACLATIYRHGLMHTDEMRTLATGTRKLTWLLSWNNPNYEHLHVTNPYPTNMNIYRINFDTFLFYEDVAKVCTKAMQVDHGGEVKKRYNSWLDLNLDVPTKKSRSSASTRQQAVDEINKLEPSR